MPTPSDAQPVLTIHLFPEERSRLLALLEGLSAEDWGRPTGCPDWSVKDIALHLLGDDLNCLSRLRDGFSQHQLGPGDDLVAFINGFNALWVRAAGRLSTRVLLDLLRWSGEKTSTYYASLDPYALGGPVSWAGPEPAPNWLEIAREYTERWVHQQQIREAVGAPLLDEPRLFAPVLATFIRGVPRALRAAEAPPGTTVAVVVEGAAGGQWHLTREQSGAWIVHDGLPDGEAATVTMSQDTSWRLFTRGLSQPEAEQRARLQGDQRLARTVLETVSVIA